VRSLACARDDARVETLQIRRLNVHQHVGDAWICGANRIFNPVRQLVSFVNGNAAIYQYMQIDVIGDAHFADEAFVEIDYARDRTCSASNILANFTARRGIENFA